LKFRTDLAIERKEILDGEKESTGVYDGVSVEEINYGDDVKCTRIKILDELGSEKFDKPAGTYITLEVEGLIDGAEGVKEQTEKALAYELENLIPFHSRLKSLVVGLGNDAVTPDALGPETVSKVRVTRHLFVMFGADNDEQISSVSCLIPGVTGMTGIETCDLIRKAVDLTEPEVVIIVDSLASRSIKRVSTTIQINDTGIEPGSGMGNMRKILNRETLGCKVISVGVPTVIDAANIIEEALSEHIDVAEEIEEYIQGHHQELIVTSTDIDSLIKDFSDIIANGINKALHPGIYS